MATITLVIIVITFNIYSFPFYTIGFGFEPHIAYVFIVQMNQCRLLVSNFGKSITTTIGRTKANTLHLKTNELKSFFLSDNFFGCVLMRRF